MLTVLPYRPPTTTPALHFPIQNSSYQLPCCSRRKDGRYKIHSKIIFSFPKKIMHTQILKSCSKTVLVVDEKKTKILKMKQLENTFFFSNLCFFNLVGVILILKSSRQGFEIFISKSQMFLVKRFGCSSHFFHSRISINIYNDIFQVKDFEL